MTDDEIIERLRSAAGRASAVKLAEILGDSVEGGLSQAKLIAYFKRAFPSIPLRTILDAAGWHRVSGAGMSDEEFETLLAPWIRQCDLLGRSSS